MLRKQAQKREVYFIATKYKNRPVDVTFYTKDGKRVAFEAVEKKRTRKGVQFFAAVP